MLGPWIALVLGALPLPGSPQFQVVAWNEAGDEALIAEVQERSSTPSLCFIEVSTGEASAWLYPLASGTLASGAPALTCDDALAALNGELRGSGFELAVNPGFCDGSDEPLFANLDELSKGADASQPVDGSFRQGLFNVSYFVPVADGDDVVSSPGHPSDEELPTLRAHRSGSSAHGMIVAGGAGARPHVVDLFYSTSGRFDDARRPRLQALKLRLHAPISPVNFTVRVFLALVGALLIGFALVLQFRPVASLR